MKRFKLQSILIIGLIPLLTYCGGVRDALEGKKRSEQSDEFLVRKKNPLQMPPDMNKMPIPGEEIKTNKLEQKDNVKELLKIKESKNDNILNNDSDLLDNMKKKIQ